jgi:hypothetical protein
VGSEWLEQFDFAGADGQESGLDPLVWNDILLVNRQRQGIMIEGVSRFDTTHHNAYVVDPLQHRRSLVGCSRQHRASLAQSTSSLHDYAGSRLQAQEN